MVIIFDPYTIHVDYPMIPCVSLIFVWLKTSAEQNSMIFPISRNILYNNYLNIVLVLSHMNPFPKPHPHMVHFRHQRPPFCLAWRWERGSSPVTRGAPLRRGLLIVNTRSLGTIVITCNYISTRALTVRDFYRCYNSNFRWSYYYSKYQSLAVSAYIVILYHLSWYIGL